MLKRILSQITGIKARACTRAPARPVRAFPFLAFLFAILVAGPESVFFSPPVSAQVVPPVVIEDLPEGTPDEYEDTVRDLVRRYEDLRERLREEIRRRDDMYTRAEVNRMLQDLQSELDEAYLRIATLEARLKESNLRHRTAEDKARRRKATLLKTEEGLLRELDTARDIVDAMQTEKIFQVGPTFSPAGTIGGLGIINLPGTRLSVVAGTDYDLREQDWSSTFGVTFGFLSQRSIVETWVRMRNREQDKSRLTNEELRVIRDRRR